MQRHEGGFASAYSPAPVNPHPSLPGLAVPFQCYEEAIPAQTSGETLCRAPGVDAELRLCSLTRGLCRPASSSGPGLAALLGHGELWGGRALPQCHCSRGRPVQKDPVPKQPQGQKGHPVLLPAVQRHLAEDGGTR